MLSFFLKLNHFTINAFTDSSTFGSKKVRRRIGHSLEFEQIKEYVAGDDIHTLNWKATAKNNQLMSKKSVRMMNDHSLFIPLSTKEEPWKCILKDCPC